MRSALSRASQRLEDPLRFPLREPNHDDAASDALCRATSLTRELRLPPSLRSPRASPQSFDRSEAQSGLRHARTRRMNAYLRPPYVLPRTPSFGLMPNLAVWPSPCAIPVRSHARAPHPFERRRPALLVFGRAASPPYPAPPRLASRLTLAALGRCVSPTSATDIRYEHPKFRSIPEPSARAAMTASLMNTELAPNAIRTAAPDRLSPIRPQVKPRLTTRSSFGQVDLRLSSSL